ncbi:caspase family protein [Planctomycetota bacterium]
MTNRRRFCCAVSVGLVSVAIAYVTLIYLCWATDCAAGETNAMNAAGAQVKYKKLALIVGINDYKYVTKLKGALNDVDNMKLLLVERFGFPDDDQHIVVLKDKKATRDAILNGVKEHLIAKATPESIVVFHYSGHGSKKLDDNGDETDGYDETLVTYDSGHRDPYPNRDIIDDELYDLLNQLTGKTPNVTFIFDSCHSGTITRGAGLARTVEPDNRPPAGQRPTPTTTTRGVDEGKSGLHPVNSRYALISGSRADEYSYEMRVDAKSYGALTWHLANQIRQAGANVTYRDIMDLVKARVTARYAAQHPQLEGMGEDQLLFSDRSIAAAPYVLVETGPGGTVTLKAGQAQGVTKGSIYDVYPPGTKSFDADTKPIAQVEVTDVDVTSSTAKVKEGKKVADASRAVEREHRWPDPVLSVYFRLKDPDKPESTPSETLMKVKEDLAKFKHITSVPTESGYDLLLREQKDEKTGKNYIITEGGDPTEISPRVAVTDPDAVSHVVKQVTHWAMWFNILGISNQQPELGLNFELKAEGAAKSTSGPSDRQVNLTLFEGEGFTMSITNKSKRYLYVALLDLSEDGSVDVVYPARRSQEFIAPDRTWTKVLETFVPEGRDSVRDILKVIATTSYADFSFLEQTAVRGGPRLATTRGKAANPLEDLLANAAVGTTRGTKLVEVGSWTTTEQVLEVRRKK